MNEDFLRTDEEITEIEFKLRDHINEFDWDSIKNLAVKIVSKDENLNAEQALKLLKKVQKVTFAGSLAYGIIRNHISLVYSEYKETPTNEYDPKELL